MFKPKKLLQRKVKKLELGFRRLGVKKSIRPTGTSFESDEHELRESRSNKYFDEVHGPYSSNVVRKLKLRSAETYKREIERLKREFLHSKKPTSEQLRIVERKLEIIMSVKPNVVRFDNIARALTELHYEGAFTRKDNLSRGIMSHEHEASITDNFFDFLRKTYHLNSESIKYGEDDPQSTAADIYYEVAHDITGGQSISSGIKKYNSVIFFSPNAFENIKQYGVSSWGIIRPTGKNPILGIMVLHSDPREVYAVAKAMLKIRPKDPVVIFDVYGNVFFP